MTHRTDIRLPAIQVPSAYMDKHHKVTSITVLFLSLLFLGASCPAPSPAPPSSPRFVVLARSATTGELESHMSHDGFAWTDGLTIRDQSGAAVRPASSPAITYDGRLYHFAYFDSNRGLRYGTSGDGVNWFVGGTPVGIYPVGDPAIAAGAGKVLIAFRTGSTISVVNAATGGRPITISASSNLGVGMAFGNGRFVLVTGVGGLPGKVQAFTSTDGVGWSGAGQVDGFGMTPDVAFANGEFQLLARVSRGGGDDIPGATMTTYRSVDAATWTRIRDLQADTTSTGMSIAGAGAEQLVLEGNALLRTTVSGQVAGGPFFDLCWTANGRPAVTRGGGQAFLDLRLTRVTIERENEGNGDDPYFLTFWFRSRVGRPGSTRVVWCDANDLNLNGVGNNVHPPQTRDIPPRMGSHAWIVEPAADALQPNAQVDVMGVVAVAVESDACPLNSVRDTARQVRGLLQTEIENLIARGTIASLSDQQQFRRDIQRATDNVERALDGNSLLSFIACTTDREDHVDDKIVVIVGTQLLNDIPASNQFSLHEGAIPTVPLVFEGEGARWRVETTASFR